MTEPTVAPLNLPQSDPVVPRATRSAVRRIAAFGVSQALAGEPGASCDKDKWVKTHRAVEALILDQAYVESARRLLQAGVARLGLIWSGDVPYIADGAFTADEVAGMELATHVLLRAAEEDAVLLVDKLLREVAVAPGPTVRTLPSQALFYALTRCVLDRPNAKLVLTLGELRAVVRHAGVKKKLGRIYLQAQRQLAARIDAPHVVPDLDLGTGVFQAGERRFMIDFDEALRPILIDDQGRHCAALPASATESERTRYAELKRSARLVASLEITRLERAMVAQSVWSADEFWDGMVRHPLAWHLARRLVWQADQGTFRLCEDKTCADVKDQAVTVTGPVWLVHPLTAGPDLVAAWSGVFADYEIIQPFAQLGREVYHPGDVSACQGRSVASGAILGLLRQGWVSDGSDSAGSLVVRDFPTGQAYLTIDPGVPVWDPLYEPFQQIVRLEWNGLSDLEISEAIRDVMRLGGV